MKLPNIKEDFIQIPLRYFQTINLNKFFLTIIFGSVILGGISGYILANNNNTTPTENLNINEKPKSAQQDTKTFRDFATGVIQKRPAPKNPQEYLEGTHFLIREGAVPVALTSSVTDLSQYEGKKVKVFGETQKAIKEGWLMDIGKVETED